MNTKMAFAARALLSSIVILYLVTMLDLERIRDVLPKLVVAYIVLAWLFVLLSTLISAIRWSTLLRQVRLVQRVKDSWRFYLVSMFYGVALPGMIGADIVRLGMSIKLHGSHHKGTLTAGILIERACGLFGILLIFIVMSSQLSAVFRVSAGFGQTPYVLAVFVCAAFAFCFFMLKTVPQKWFSKESAPQGIFKQLGLLIERFRDLSLASVVWILMISIAAHLLDIVASYYLARALHIDVSFYLFLLIVPMTYVLTALPISLGGLGVREGIFTFFLTQVGVVVSDAVLLAFLIYINRLAVSMIGGVIQPLDKNIGKIETSNNG
ncbi:MAG: flippase-like domain-containing protein [Gammaproteobacteria bacterium]|nr:flippase-like domain-containing protein [Gammaproteobacteria bacterium]